MIRFLADEDFNGRIFRGLLLRNPDLDMVRAQNVGLLGASDDAVLQYAEESNRIVISHDNRTMPKYYRERLASGFHIPGLFIVDDLAQIGECIEDLLIIVECSGTVEWRDQMYYLPWK